MTDRLEHDLETKRTEIDDTLHALEDKLTLRHFTDEARAKATEAVGAAGDFVRRHPLPIGVMLGIAVGGATARLSRRRAFADGLRDFLDYDTIRELVDHAVARSQSRSGGARRFARRTIRGIERGFADTPPWVSATSRSITHSLGGLTGAAVRAGRRARDGGRAAEHRVIEMAHEQPALVGLGTLALAIGAGVALALSRRS
jgi:ElaB/YqjD/DUF883 family membrane-anchored ribosome-binding protein